MAETMRWRSCGLREALDHAIGRTIRDGDWCDREHITWFTDGTAVRMEVETYHGSEWTGEWNETSFAIGAPEGEAEAGE